MFQLLVNTNAGNKWLMFNGWLSHPYGQINRSREPEDDFRTKKAVSVTKHSEFKTISPPAFDSLRHA